MRFRRLVLLSLVSLAAALPLAAQTPADIRAKHQAMLQMEQRMILSFIDSMPQQWFRDRATPPQRDFAMQLFHAAVTYPLALSRFLGAPSLPNAMDSTAATASKDALRGYVNTVYNWSVDFLRHQTDSARTAQVRLFGMPMPGWQVWDELHQHTMWTLGQVVANFRAHDLRPAPFIFF